MPEAGGQLPDIPGHCSVEHVKKVTLNSQKMRENKDY
jgi:hypothetical protein